MKKIITLVSFCLMMLVAKSQSCQTTYSGLTKTVCDINPYTFNNHALSTSGTYFDTLVNFHGCDSIIYLYLTVLPSNISKTVSICTGNTYLFKSQQLSSSGIYKDSLTNYLGCDSIITLNLAVSSTYPSPQKLNVSATNVCGTNPITFNVDEQDTTTNIPSTSCAAVNGGHDCLKYFQMNNSASGTITHNVSPYYNPATATSFGKFTAGWAYGIYANVDTSYLYNGSAMMIWIDADHSGTFDAGELVYNTTGSGTYSGSIVIPQNALLGATLMRIRTVAGSSYSILPCANFSTGSTDDFKVYIVGANNYDLIYTGNASSPVASGTNYYFYSAIANSGGYYTKVTNPQGCSTLTDTVVLGILKTSSDTIYDSICHGMYNFYGQLVNQTGSYVQHFTNSVGCDSSITLKLKSNIGFSAPNYGLCHGTNFIFNNQTIVQPGTYYDTLTNYMGCDSLITMTAYTPTTYTWQYHYLCAGAVDSFKHQPLTTGGYYYDTLPDHANCGDSIIALYLYFYPAVIANAGLDYTGCGGNGVALGGFPTASGGGNPNGAFSYSWSPSTGLSNPAFAHPVASPNANTMYKVLVTDAYGCSGMDSMQFNVTSPASYSSINQNICSGSYFFNNQTLTASGVYYDTLINHSGCDSIITLNLAVNQVPVDSFTATYNSCFNTTGCATININGTNSLGAFPTFNWNGGTAIGSGMGPYTVCYSSPGVHQISMIVTVNGCQSSLFTDSIILKSGSTFSFNQTICGSQTYFFNGQNLNTSGIYYDTLTNAIGCDSLITLHLNVNPISNTTLNQSVCAGNTYFFKGQNLSIPGIYKDTLTNYLGCDSFIVLNLTVNPLPVATFTAQYRSCKNTNSIADILFTGSNVASYTWLFAGATPSSASTANATISYSSTGTHQISLTATAANGCWITVNDTVAMGTNCVWPGDANSDLVADNLDIFPIGQLNGTTGPIRNHASLVWVDQPSTPFAATIPGTTIDARFADCNGDGVIDGNDTTAILQNYGLVHVKNRKVGTGNLLNMTIGPDTMYQNTKATILVGMGTAAIPADSIYGVAFSFHVDPKTIDTNSIRISTPPSWLFTNSTDHFQLYKLDKSGTAVHVGLVRNNQIAKSGFGNFVTITIDITTGNIVGRDEASFNRQHKFLCTIDNISILKLDGRIVPNVELADSSAKILYNRNVGINNLGSSAVSQLIVPNPATNNVFVRLKGYDYDEQKQLLVMDATGRIVLQKTFTTNQVDLNLQDFSNGIYIVKIISEKGVSESKLMKE